MAIQHVQVPHHLNDLIKTSRDVEGLEHGDQVIYAAIRKNMNKSSRTCRPYYTTIAKLLKCSTQKVSEAVNRLLATKLLERNLIIEGKKQHYEFYFPRTEFDEKFEMFTWDFLSLDIPLNIKEYYMTIQPWLVDLKNGKRYCSFSNSILSEKTGWSIPTIKKYNTWLINNGYLAEEVTSSIDEYGLPIIRRHFDLELLSQAALWVKRVEARINENSDDIQKVKEELEVLKKWKAAKEKEESLKRNYTSPPIEVSF